MVFLGGDRFDWMVPQETTRRSRYYRNYAPGSK